MAGNGRIVAWFSCGATSAVAAKMAIRWAEDNDRECVVALCDTLSTEHPDNERFIGDIERWLGREVLRLRSERYADTWAVWEDRRYLAGVQGAPCTLELKKRVRQQFERPFSDVQVFGFDAAEDRRANRFRENNPEANLWAPLIEAGLTKEDCIGILEDAGIERPAMYRLGYRNNNCIGCVKGGAGYWNKIRRDFPDVFKRMAALERNIGAAICKTEPLDRSTGRRQRLRVFLDELPENAGRYEQEPAVECGVLCQLELF